MSDFDGYGGADCAVQPMTDVAQFQLLARRGRYDALSGMVSQRLKLDRRLMPLEGAELDGVRFYATSPREFWVMSDEPRDHAKTQQMLSDIDKLASVFDQSHGRFVVRLSGRGAAAVLAKGTSLDFASDALPACAASHTMFEQVPGLVAWRRSVPRFDVSVPGSYFRSFSNWLADTT